MMTERRQEIYQFLCEFFPDHQRMPTMREVGRQFGISHVGARAQMLAIASCGYLEIDGHNFKFTKLKPVLTNC